MRRLFLLVSAVVLVDTMFFAAVAPLLPDYSDELDLSKTAAGVLTAAYPAGTFAGALPAAGSPRAGASSPRCCSGLSLLGVTSLVFAFADTSCCSTPPASSRAWAAPACGRPGWPGSCPPRPPTAAAS